MSQVLWTIDVSPETDLSVKGFLAVNGKGGQGELARFVEDAVHAYLFDLAVRQVKAASADKSDDESTALADAAAVCARSGRN